MCTSRKFIDQLRAYIDNSNNYSKIVLLASDSLLIRLFAYVQPGERKMKQGIRCTLFLQFNIVIHMYIKNAVVLP